MMLVDAAMAPAYFAALAGYCKPRRLRRDFVCSLDTRPMMSPFRRSPPMLSLSRYAEASPARAIGLQPPRYPISSMMASSARELGRWRRSMAMAPLCPHYGRVTASRCPPFVELR